MPITNLTMQLQSGTRAQMRDQVIHQFLLEQPGTGKGDLRSAYIYNVEQFPSGGHILLKRPASLNKGMDFTVHVDSFKFRPKGFVDMPSHPNVIDDLLNKKKLDPITYQAISSLINYIYNCANITPTQCAGINIAGLAATNLSIPQVLMCIKWLFIEQDVTYWSWSCRKMLYDALHTKVIC